MSANVNQRPERSDPDYFAGRHAEASEKHLVARARNGDEAACREIVRRYGPTVYDRVYRTVGHHELAEDLTQDTFAKAFHALRRRGPKRRPSAWILSIANNMALDYVRRRRPDSTRSPFTVTPSQIDDGAMRVTPTPGDTPTPSTDVPVSVAALKRALRRLRPTHRQCIVLRYVEGRSYAQIARIMNVAEGTVGTYLHDARTELKRMLQQ